MNNEPVAWRTHYPSGWEYKDGNPPFELKGNSQLLYTHPTKTLTPLTEDECRAIIEKHNWFAKSWAEMAMEIQDAILRKAQEK